MTNSNSATQTHAAGDINIGMAFMIVAMLLLPVGDTLAKILTGVMHPVEVAMWRFVSQTVWFVPVAFFMRRYLRGPLFSPVVALSGALMVMCVISLITAFKVMPIATAIAIFFVEPLVLTLLAGLILREKIGPRRYIAIAVGLVGAMLVIRPSFAQFGWPALLPLIAAVTYALNMIVLRHASKQRSALTVQFGATIYAAIGLTVLAVGLSFAGGISLAGPMAGGWAWQVIVAGGALSAVTFVLIAEAFRRAEAGVLAPFQYLEILGATAAGYLVFGDFPDWLTWVGIAIILASGIYVFHRERQVGRYRPDEPEIESESAR
ncbi:DMT family transporter [Maritalea mediterranea]|uniref:DMT family transporter n=1 Tax=Maritalea mediterranea TaxID=2909667 RepID=A0ABS9EAV2_9HYPH|nr:DMT family transporter [Maritalea mediterranea]MCF4099322.1 DMT family transporter [Maritalea mediterranea]